MQPQEIQTLEQLLAIYPAEPLTFTDQEDIQSLKLNFDNSFVSSILFLGEWSTHEEDGCLLVFMDTSGFLRMIAGGYCVYDTNRNSTSLQVPTYPTPQEAFQEIQDFVASIQ